MSVLGVLAAAALMAGCELGEPDKNQDFSIEYRPGTEESDYIASGERGSIIITEVNWAGSVEGSLEEGYTYHPDDIFIEIQNRYFRPVNLEGWRIEIDAALPRHPYRGELPAPTTVRREYVVPARLNGEPVQPNEYVVIAARTDGAFPDADFVIEDLELPRDGFNIVLRDFDLKLIEEAGSDRHRPYAGSWDLVAARSMERVQLIFANRGNREAAWHSYSSNPDEARHEALAREVDEAYRALTLASPGVANSVDYSGNNSAGSFE